MPVILTDNKNRGVLKNSKISLTIAVVLCLGIGWYLLSDNSGQDSPNPQSASAYTDSISSPEQPVITEQEDTVRSPVGENLGPGTALVKATIMSVNSNDTKNAHIVVQVKEILEYGSSTPPIAAQEQLMITIERMIKKKPDLKDSMREGNTATMVLSSEKGMSFGESESKKRWSMIELKPQNK